MKNHWPLMLFLITFMLSMYALNHLPRLSPIEVAAMAAGTGALWFVFGYGILLFLQWLVSINLKLF